MTSLPRVAGKSLRAVTFLMSTQEIDMIKGSRPHIDWVETMCILAREPDKQKLSLTLDFSLLKRMRAQDAHFMMGEMSNANMARWEHRTSKLV